MTRLRRLVGLLMLVLVGGCAGSHPRRVPLGEVFPAVTDESLEGRKVTVPTDFEGSPTLLQLPTIPGLLPRMCSGKIDDGMRRGIPEEDWGGVITVYADGERIARFTDSEDGLTGRVLLLDRAGRVGFFHDRGFSIGSLNRLRGVLERLPEPSGG